MHLGRISDAARRRQAATAGMGWSLLDVWEAPFLV